MMVWHCKSQGHFLVNFVVSCKSCVYGHMQHALVFDYTAVNQRLVAYLCQKNHYYMYYLKHSRQFVLKYTVQDERQVANIARGKADCYIYHEIRL